MKEDGIGTVGTEIFFNSYQGTIQIFSITQYFVYYHKTTGS
jgi:hypothetical protein